MGNRTKTPKTRRTPSKEIAILKRRSEAFARWITEQNLKLSEVADLLGMSQQGVCNLRNGNRAPSLRIAAVIAEVTHGAVPIEAWTR